MSIKQFAQANSIQEAVALLATPGSRPLAGGTDLLVQLREEGADEDISLLVDVHRIPALQEIGWQDDLLQIGAAVTHSVAARHPLLLEFAPFLAQACHSVGSPQIRNRGTLGGSVCNASPAADPIPPLLALEAQAVLCGPAGERSLPLAAFLSAPNRPLLAQGELLTALRFAPVEGARTAFVKLGRRKALAIARMNVAALAVQKSGVVETLRLVPGAVLPKAMRITAAEELLLGKAPSRELIDRAARAVAVEMVAVTGRRWSTPYKEPVIETLCRRALEQVLEVAQ